MAKLGIYFDRVLAPDYFLTIAATTLLGILGICQGSIDLAGIDYAGREFRILVSLPLREAIWAVVVGYFFLFLVFDMLALGYPRRYIEKIVSRVIAHLFGQNRVARWRWSLKDPRDKELLSAEYTQSMIGTD